MRNSVYPQRVRAGQLGWNHIRAGTKSFSPLRTITSCTFMLAPLPLRESAPCVLQLGTSSSSKSYVREIALLAEWQTLDTSNEFFAVFVRFETLRNCFDPKQNISLYDMKAFVGLLS